MLSRRLLLGGAGAALAVSAAAHAAESQPGDDGLLREPWFLESFLELPDDVATAAANGKRLAVMWELKGCPYCRETHQMSFGNPDIADFIKTRFEILQLNIIGDREVADFDGEKLPEKKLADKYGVRFTPTVQFFPVTANGLAARKPREREVLRVQGYLQPKDFRNTFAFVADNGYERGSLRDFLKAQG